MKYFKSKLSQNLVLLLVAFLSGILLSPKWFLAIAAWIYYPVILRFYRDSNWKWYLISIPVLSVGATISQADVFPMGVSVVFVFMLVSNIIGLIPFIIDRLAYKHIPGWLSTLIFPSVLTLFNYYMDQGPQGTWANPAYTQYSFLPLMQIASITGIYGVNFLMYWWASFINYIYESRSTRKEVTRLAFIMPLMLLLSVTYGFVQLNSARDQDKELTTATISMDNSGSMKTMYEAEYGKKIDVPKNISQSDPILVELQKGMLSFMADPDADRFEEVYESMDSILVEYVNATRAAALDNAKVVVWSEGAIFNIKSREKEYEMLASSLADDLDIYLFFATAVFHPEKVGKEDLFIENKVLTFDPEGQLLNTYFKNIPIQGVEPSFPGDGNIPVISTPYGDLSPIICYDADHPSLIAQINNKSTDILIVPTGDWKAISPYHTYMAAIRCIENGVSMIKATSNGLSAVIDDKGRILSSYDYFDDEDVKMMVYKFSVQKSDTLYAQSFPLFLGGIKLLALILILVIVIKFILKKISGDSFKLVRKKVFPRKSF